MEDLPGADSPPVNDTELPEGNNDPQDPQNPEIDEEDNAHTPPLAEPTMDMEATEDAGAPIQAPGDDDDDSDALSEIDEAQFEDFDPNAIAIEERPRVVDADGVAMLGKHKRKREEGDEGRKKRKEGRRERPKKSKKRAEDDDDLADGDEFGGKRRRKEKASGEKRKARTPEPENDDHLTPEERKQDQSDIEDGRTHADKV